MKVLTGKELAAAVFSPLAAGPGMFIGSILYDPSIPIKQEIWITLIQPFYYVLLTLPVSAVGMLILGIPFYLLLKVLGYNYPVLVAVSGGPLSYIVYWILGGDGEYGDNMYLIIFVTSGFVVSITAALILRLEKKSNKSPQPTASGGG